MELAAKKQKFIAQLQDAHIHPQNLHTVEETQVPMARADVAHGDGTSFSPFGAESRGQRQQHNESYVSGQSNSSGRAADHVGMKECTAAALNYAVASAASGVPGPGASAGERNETEDCCRRWLLGLDKGEGALLQYFDKLQAEFDGDLVQVAAVRRDVTDGQSAIDAVDPIFWEVIGVKKMGHKLLFARAIANIQQR